LHFCRKVNDLRRTKARGKDRPHRNALIIIFHRSVQSGSVQSGSSGSVQSGSSGSVQSGSSGSVQSGSSGSIQSGLVRSGFNPVRFGSVGIPYSQKGGGFEEDDRTLFPLRSVTEL